MERACSRDAWPPKQPGRLNRRKNPAHAGPRVRGSSRRHAPSMRAACDRRAHATQAVRSGHAPRAQPHLRGCLVLDVVGHGVGQEVLDLGKDLRSVTGQGRAGQAQQEVEAGQGERGTASHPNHTPPHHTPPHPTTTTRSGPPWHATVQQQHGQAGATAGQHKSCRCQQAGDRAAPAAGSAPAARRRRWARPAPRPGRRPRTAARGAKRRGRADRSEEESLWSPRGVPGRLPCATTAGCRWEARLAIPGGGRSAAAHAG